MGLNLCRMDGSWVKSNSAFLKIIGYSAEEANSGQLTYWQVTPLVYEKAEQAQLDSLKTKGVYGPYEKEFIRKDGTLVPVRLNGFMIEIDSEKYIWSMIEDLSFEKSMREELAHAWDFNMAISENLPVAVFAKDSKDEWRFTVWNRRAEELFKIRREAVIGNSDYDLFPQEQADFFRAKDEEALSASAPVIIKEEPVNPLGGRPLYLRTIKVALKDASGHPRYVLGITEDITQEWEAAQELLRSHQRLKEAMELAERASQAKSMFLSNMSHEIRTPLHSIIGFTELISNTELTQEQAQFLRMVQKGSARLMDVVNDILDLQKIEAGNMLPNWEDENILALLDSTAELLRHTAERRKIEYSVDLDIPTNLIVRTDSKFLNQILTNLIGNAVKFTAEGGSVAVRGQYLPRREGDGQILLAVSDTGIGMSEEQQLHIFEPFEQVDSSIRKRFGGTGLGLSIVQALVKMLKGEIKVTSEEGQGTKFEVTLPVTLTDQV